MANKKSSIKRDQLIKKANAKNKASKTLLKTNLKKFSTAVADGDRKAAESAYNVAAKTVDRAATKNLIHKNNAAHKKSSMARALNTLEAK